MIIQVIVSIGKGTSIGSQLKGSGKIWILTFEFQYSVCSSPCS